MTESMSFSDRGAEMATLGSILAATNPNEAAEALFTVAAPEEFWSERQLAEILDGMWRAKQPIDPQLLLSELMSRGIVEKVGGAAHLHTLIERAWLPEHAKFYAAAVHEAWRRRSISQAATRAIQQMENPGSDASDVAIELMDAAERTYNAGRRIAVDAPQDVLDFVQGPSAYDWLVPGLIERLDRLMLVAPEGLAKALAWNTPIPTPKGWRLMAELSVGDEVFAPDGQPTRVVAATEVMLGHRCSEIRFSDGARIVADDGHLWLTETRQARESIAARRRDRSPATSKQAYRWIHPAVVTTAHIGATVRDDKGLIHAIPTCAPLAYPPVELPIDPYVLGAWLGDGTARSAQITTADPEIVERIRSAGYPCRPLPSCGPYAYSMSTGTKWGPRAGRLVTDLRSLDLIRNKHVPRAYLEAAPDQRLALLQGLMDTDGTVTPRKPYGRGSGSYATYCTTSPRLAQDVAELLYGLGIKTVIREDRATLKGRDHGVAYRMTFSTALPVFHLPRKAERLQAPVTRRPILRYIEAVTPVASVPVRCIEVDRPDGLYLAGRQCVATHNSVLLAQIALATSIGLHPFTMEKVEPKRALVIDCEISPRQQRRRWKWMLDVAEAIGHPVRPEMLRIEPRPDGLDLVGKDLPWVKAKARAAGADMIVIGPLYRLHKHNINDEEVARELVSALDEIRIGSGVALLVEAHAGHTQGFRGEREIRPRGSSLFMGWTEFGLGLKPVKGDKRVIDVTRWRGDRDARRWPSRLRWGTGMTLPWVECAPDEAWT